MKIFIVCNYCKTIKGCDDSGDVQTCLHRGCNKVEHEKCKKVVLKLNVGNVNLRMYPCALCQYKQDKSTICFASDE